MPGARADQRAQEALAWVRDELAVRVVLDSFERRLVETLSRQRLSRRELPTAAAAIYRFHQHLHHLISARKGASAWIGEPGCSMTADLTVDHVERVATPSGPVHRHHLTDALGRHATWDSSAHELKLGSHRLQITVGEHCDGKPPLTILTCCEPA